MLCFVFPYPGGRVILLEKCLNPDGCGPQSATLFDMYLMPHCHGKVRTKQEYTTMFNKCNFSNVNFIQSVASCLYDIIVAHK